MGKLSRTPCVPTAGLVVCLEAKAGPVVLSLVKWKCSAVPLAMPIDVSYLRIRQITDLSGPRGSELSHAVMLGP